jgi:Mg2+ and Co2+ transporter CorA
MDDRELEDAYDALVQHIAPRPEVSVDFYLGVLERRRVKCRTETMERLTKVITVLTVVITVLTVINVVAVIASSA